MKALVAFGTRYGSTTGIAEKIAGVLVEAGNDVDIVDLGKERIRDVDAYDFVVVGSGIQVGKWTKESLRFLDENKEALRQRKLAMFATSGQARDKSKQEEYLEEYVAQVAEKYGLSPIRMGVFVGAFDMNKYNFPVKLLMKTLIKDLESFGYDINKPVDLREWDKIEEWATTLEESM